MLNFLLENPNWEEFDHSAYLKKRKIISLPKRGKDMTHVENHRPISMLETIFKLISKFLIEKVLTGIFRSDLPNQFGFVPTHTMSTCSLTLISLINALKDKLPCQAFLLFVDIQAAFDMAKLCYTYFIRILPSLC